MSKKLSNQTPISAREYLAQCYQIPQNLPKLPLEDENFLQHWRKANGFDAIYLLAKIYDKDFNFDWRNTNAIKIFFAQTLAGKLPVVETFDHEDFSALASFLSGASEVKKIVDTVNAFTIPAKIRGERHRIILLNRAPYSNVAAGNFGLADEEWLNISHRLRLRHESAHYETLRLFGGMKNHALDEILADTLGQIAAFGNFSAARQRIFFGLHGEKCEGRLQFYCQKVLPEERPKIYQAVDKILDEIENEVAGISETDILRKIAGRSIADRLENIS